MPQIPGLPKCLAQAMMWTVVTLCLAQMATNAARRADAADAGPPPAYRIWNDSSGQHQTEAKLLDFEDGSVSLKKKDGSIITIPVQRLSTADRDYVQNWAAPRQPDAAAPPAAPAVASDGPPSDQRRPGSRATIDFNPSGKKKPPADALPQAKEVVVTGVGTDADKALQNAFSQAIEQTVGLLVDSETVVKNDQLIRDEVLTFSRGYVEKYEVVKQWQADGLHHATIQATVARDKLAEKLRGMKIAVADTRGEPASRQFEFDAKNEEQAAEIFQKALGGSNITDLTNVEIVGKPTVKRHDNRASVHVVVALRPDQARWNEFARGLKQILTKTSTRRASIIVDGGEGRESHVSYGRNLPSFGRGSVYEAEQRLKRQLGGDGVLVGLFSKSSADGSRMEWDLFRVPGSLEGAIKAHRPAPPLSQLYC